MWSCGVLSNMNINSKFNREEETVIVSNEKGIVEIREYQDNIDDILVLEDVIEKLENELAELESIYNKTVQDLEEIDTSIEDAKGNWKKIWICFLVILFIAPIVMRFVRGFLDNESFMQIMHYFFELSWVEVLYSEVMPSVFFGVSIFSNYSPFKVRSLKVKKSKNESKIEELKLKISLWKQHIFELNNRRNDLLKEKEKKNMENISTKVKTIFYQKELELQRAYLKQMYQDNWEAQEERNSNTQKNMILGRFKKKKGN